MYVLYSDQLRVKTEREESHVYPSIPFRPQDEETGKAVARKVEWLEPLQKLFLTKS